MHKYSVNKKLVAKGCLPQNYWVLIEEFFTEELEKSVMHWQKRLIPGHTEILTGTQDLSED